MGPLQIRDLFNAPRRRGRPVVWARRIAGLAIVVSGGTLLAGDLVRMVAAGPVPLAMDTTITTPRPLP